MFIRDRLYTFSLLITSLVVAIFIAYNENNIVDIAVHLFMAVLAGVFELLVYKRNILLSLIHI